jgi:hypothetical protein
MRLASASASADTSRGYSFKKTHSTLQPDAFRIAAATAESTPPETPTTTCDSLDGSSTNSQKEGNFIKAAASELYALATL